MSMHHAHRYFQILVVIPTENGVQRKHTHTRTPPAPPPFDKHSLSQLLRFLRMTCRILTLILSRCLRDRTLVPSCVVVTTGLMSR